MSKLSERLIEFNKDRLPEMVELKYGSMAENHFRFFRGTCHLFYEDLANSSPLPLSPLAWICGDLHIENFGSYKGDNKLVYFDLNDFDEAVLAPVSYELARMTASIFIAFDNLGFYSDKALKMAQLFIRIYALTLVNAKAVSIEPRTAKGIVKEFLTRANHSRERDLLKKRTISKKRKIMLSLEDERHFKLDKKLKSELKSHINEWVKNSNDGPYNYEVVSAVFRLAGTGSIGVKRYLFLLKSTNTKNKYLLLDMKQSMQSSVYPFLPVQQLDWPNESERIINIQKRMQQVPAALLSTTTFRGDTFVIQELQPVKDTLKFKQLNNYRDMYQVISDMATLTASSHLRSGGMQGSSVIDELIAFGKSEEWQPLLVEYAESYAATAKSNYQRFMKDFKNGLFKLKEENTTKELIIVSGRA